MSSLDACCITRLTFEGLMVRNRGSSERHPSSLGDSCHGDRHLSRFIPSGLPPLGPQAARPPGVVIIGMLSGVMLRLFLFGIETGDTIELLYPFADFFVKSFWAA